MRKELFTLGAALLTARCALAVVQDAVIEPNVYNSNTGVVFSSGKTFDTAGNLLTLFLKDEHVSMVGGGYANRDQWWVSNDGGLTRQSFDTQDSYFDFSFDEKLTATVSGYRQESGIRIDNGASPDGHLLISPTGGPGNQGEVAAFGGAIQFYSWTTNQNLRYQNATTVNLRARYSKSTDTTLSDSARYFIEYFYNGKSSGPLVIDSFDPNGNRLGYMPPPYNLGSYLQVVNDPNNPNNTAKAEYSNIKLNYTTVANGYLAINLTLGGYQGPNPVSLKMKYQDSASVSWPRVADQSSATHSLIVGSLPPGIYQLTITAPGYLTKKLTVPIMSSPSTPIPVTLIPGDTNGDNVIDDTDLLAVINNFLVSTTGPIDVTYNGIVDDSDLLAVINNFLATGN